MTDFDNEETLPLESEDAPEQGYEEPDAPTLETPVGVPSEDVDELDEDLLIEPLHEAEGSVLGLDQEGVEGVPDLYQDLDLPPSDEEWDELPETPELSESYEVENEYEELLNLGEETFEIEEFGPVASSSSILHYEIQARTYEEQPWETIALVNPEDEMLEVADLPVGETWSFRIRTVFTNGESSAWSAPSPVIFPPDMLAPGIPSTPVVVGNAAGIGVTWDGLDESGRPMPPDFARVIIWQSPTGEAGTFERRASIPGAMEAILTGYSANEPHYFAFTAMDFAGNESGFSQIATGYRIPLTDVEELKAELERLDQTDADLTEAVEGAEDALGALADRQAEAETEIEAAKDRITGAESTLGPLSGDVDKAKQEAEAARQAAEAAEARVVEAMANMQSVLANGSFESGLDGWTAQNAVSPTEHGVYISETVARSGERSLALSKQWDFVVYGSPVHVTPGETWELSGFYYCNIGPSVSISIDYLGEGVRTSAAGSRSPVTAHLGFGTASTAFA